MRSLIIVGLVPVNNGNALTRYFCIVAPDVAVNNRTYLGLHVKCPILNEYRFLFTDFNVPNTEFHENLSSGSRADKCGQTDDTKLTDAFLDYTRTRLKPVYLQHFLLLLFPISRSPLGQYDLNVSASQ
jgi:hypothetical protein